MAASNVTIEVQEYLDKHKINALFEDMKAKLTKNLPSDPITYLVTVLKGIQERKKRPVSSRDSASNGRVEVEGKAIKPVATDKLAKSTGNIRPTSTSTPKKLPLQSSSVPAVTSRSSSSKLKAPNTPTTPKATTKDTPRTSKDTPRTSKDTPRPSKTATSRTSKATTVSSKPSSTVRPSTAPSNGQAKSTRMTKPQPSSSTSKVASKPTTPRTTASKPAPSKATPSKSTPSKSTPSKPASGTARRVLKSSAPAVPTATATNTVKASEESIDEFFGEKKKSSSKQMFVSKQEEITELEGVKEKPSVDEEADREMTSTEEAPREDTTLIDAYLEKKKGQNKNTRDDHLKNLQDMILTDQKSADCGSRDNDEVSDNGEETVAVLEDIQVLQEEEGVDIIKSQDGHAMPVTKKQVIATGQEMICARTMTTGDMVAMTADEDFESASQIISQGNIPSWDASTTVTVQSSSNVDSQRPSDGDDNDSTVVSMATTAESKDEWAGLTQAHQPPVISDSESEVQVPKVPLTGKGWTPPPTQESDEPSTTATSKDEWAGLTQSHQPPVISDSESEVQVPKMPPPPTQESDEPLTTTSKDEWAGLTQAHQPPVISDSESEVQVPKMPPPPMQESDEPLTTTSKDEWVGLTQAYQPPVISDSESEVQVPKMPPPPTQESHEPSTTATSKDEWAGLTQSHQPPVISDSESEVQVPKVPLTGKGWTPPPTQESDDHSTAQQWAT